MREILFRGKRDYNGKWVEGSLLVWPDGSTEMCHTNPNSNDELLKVSVSPETVGQYIGMKDRNGKMVFEGDIIELKGCRWGVGFENTAFAVMEGPSMQFAMFEQYRWDHKKREWVAPDYWEVVGNIYDNPELLDVDGEGERRTDVPVTD